MGELQVARGLGDLAALDQQHRQVEMGVRVLGIELQRLAILLHRLVLAAHEAERRRQIVVVGELARPALDGDLELLDRQLGLVLLEEIDRGVEVQLGAADELIEIVDQRIVEPNVLMAVALEALERALSVAQLAVGEA